ncbi:beta-ketoacyl synthase N-terminal-like domain-containing protein [Actinopolyspora sp. H202]|uniref:beta-ketoacyl synthase N-terminal-like domain-containing protein n=1 Tax=Actinopolyspora sp. H202 TaxID=1500456 RepID=UPI003EE51805
MSGQANTGQELAVVGTACLLPGANTPEQFWRTIASGSDFRVEGGTETFGTGPEIPGGWGDEEHRITTTRGGFVTEPDIDLDGLGIPEQRLRELDDVVRWPLHTVRAALADAGMAEADERLARTGLVLGNYSFPTKSSVELCVPLVRSMVDEGMRRADIPVPGGEPTGHGVAAENLRPSGLPATVVGSAFGLGGPTLALDAACSSALYGVSLARDYLGTGKADVMLAGAVCAPDPLLIHLSFSDLGAYPEDGRSVPFDAGSNGILTGQGAGILVLKRLADAERDGDRIHAVVSSIGLTNDGAGKHLLSPSETGQIGAYEHAYRDVSPDSVDYIECHATGTPLGDATELRGISAFFGERVPWLGSVKGNIGHLLTVAGFSSMLKAVLMLREGVVPPLPGLDEVRTPEGGEGAAARVVHDETGNPAGATGPSRIGVSAFGFGGTNAHLLLDAHDGRSSTSPDRTQHAEAVTVVGLGARAAAATSPTELHRALHHGANLLRELPEPRWYGSDAISDSPAAVPVEQGYMASLEVAASTYRIPPAELGHFNPQHLALFQAAEQALDEAGLHAPGPGTSATDLPPRRVAVVVAMEMDPRTHSHRARFDIGAHVRAECARAGVDIGADEMDSLEAAVRGAVHDRIGSNEVLSYIGNIMASRISASRNLTGPSFTVSSDETAGARAIEVAQLLLCDPSVEGVLVGGVDLAASAENTAADARLTNEAGVTALPNGDGAAAVLLTRERQAEEWPRRYATVDGLHLRTERHPGADSVRAGARAALAEADIDRTELDYVELVGSSTEELTGLISGIASLVPRPSDGDPTCVLGESASLTGNTRSAAVLLSLVRVCVSMYLAELPVSSARAVEAASAVSDLDSSALCVNTGTEPWLRSATDTDRRAMLSVVGRTGTLAGTVAHLLLRGADVRSDEVSIDWQRREEALILPITGRDGTELARRAAVLRDELTANPARQVIRSAIDAADRRGYRAVLVARNDSELVKELTAAERDLPDVITTGGEWATPAGSYCTADPIGTGKIAFVYPGAFTAYPRAGDGLFRLFPGLLARFESGCRQPGLRYKQRALYPRATGGVERGKLMRHESGLIEDIPTMLALGTNLAVLHTQLLRDELGIVPDGAFGYSLGESSMLFATGVWAESSRDDSALTATPLFRDQLRGPKRLIRRTWGIDDETPDSAVWTTRVLLTAPTSVRAGMHGLDRVFLTHVNTPTEVVVAGAPEQCERLIERLGCQAARAPANHVMHNSLVDPVLSELADLNRYPMGDGPAPGTELLSGYTGGPSEVSDPDEIAWRIARTLRDTVDFAALTETAHERGYRYFVEMGPAATCTRWIGETLREKRHLAVPIDNRGKQVGASVARLLARLHSHGVDIDLARLYPAESAESARDALTVSATCGGESIVDRVATACAAVRSESSTWRYGMSPAADSPSGTAGTGAIGGDAITEAPSPTRSPSLSTGAEDVLFEGDGSDGNAILVEGEPFVYPPAIREQLSNARTRPVPDTPAAVAPASSSRPGEPRPPASPERTGQRAAADVPASHMSLLSRQIAEAHRAALRAQDALLWETMRQLEPDTPPPAVDDGAERSFHTGAVARTGPSAPTPVPTAPDRGGAPETSPTVDKPILDERDLLEFAGGSVGEVFGSRFAEIDAYPRRVRLPEPPYLFVSRVTELAGRTGVFEPSSITTEYDIPHDAWFAVDGLTPCAVTIEAGQCDLLLISYLGIDFHNRGERVYRLLDSRLVFHGPLPRAGQTLRYRINIDRFVWNDGSLLFFFNYRCYADDELILELLDACAGFFTKTELDNSIGVVTGESDRRRRAEFTESWFKPLARTPRTELSDADLRLLTEGRRGEVFGPEWDQHADGCNPSLRLPDEMLRMIDEIPLIDRLGGPRSLGELTAVKNLEPDGWYFRCHFTGDPVLAGSMVAEGAVQLLQTYSLYLGMHLVFPDAEFQSVPGLETEVKVRGQITPETSRIRYHAEITELSMLPRPTVIADIVVYDGEKPIISMRDFGIQVREKPGTPYRPERGGVPEFLGRRNHRGEAAFINELHLAHAAKGDLATAMGTEFEIYDNRRAPHIPNGDFQFVDRIMRLDGTRGELTPGSTMATEYDSPPEAWYYRDNSRAAMPNCVFMETSLQAAILLGYYIGATLETPEDELSIRNLDGNARLVTDMDLRGRTIRHESELLSHQTVTGATLQNFGYRLYADDVLVYEGESLFGYFTADALSQQVGLDAGRYVPPWLDEQQGSRVRTLPVRARDEWFRPDPESGLRLDDGHLRLVDEVDVVDGGGRFGEGYLRGRRVIDPDDWYFSCHFHRDPVMPGSLGVEAVIQALQLHVIDSGLASGMSGAYFAIPTDVAMSWKYRGQILRGDREMTFDLHVKRVHRENGRLLVIADANVWKPGLRIYELHDVAVEVRAESAAEHSNTER